jgi:hypothetical protein
MKRHLYASDDGATTTLVVETPDGWYVAKAIHAEAEVVGSVMAGSWGNALSAVCVFDREHGIAPVFFAGIGERKVTE